MWIRWLPLLPLILTYVCLSSPISEPAGRRQNYSTSKSPPPTYEGWMVLCNEGAQNRVRLDMISVLSKERTLPAYDLLASPDFRR